jgi:hypothetical protein
MTGEEKTTKRSVPATGKMVKRNVPDKNNLEKRGVPDGRKGFVKRGEPPADRITRESGV